MVEQNTVSSMPDSLFCPSVSAAVAELLREPEEPPTATQCSAVLSYIKEFGSITALDALRDLGIMRLGARVWDLRQNGYNVDADTVTVQNRWGKDCHVARYTLREGRTTDTVR